MAHFHTSWILIADWLEAKYEIIFIMPIWQMWFAWATPREKWYVSWYSYTVVILGV